MKSHILEQLDNYYFRRCFHTSKCYPSGSNPEGVIRKTYTVKYVYYSIT